MHLYNDIDEKACAWLSVLVQYELLANGKIDCCSISDVRHNDLEEFAQQHYFCGIGGWPHALDISGFPRNEKVVTASLPCQPFSVAGKKQGKSDDRHLWPIFFELMRRIKPPIIFGEQVASSAVVGKRFVGKTGNEADGKDQVAWIDGVFGDLENIGYTCGAIIMGAHSASSPHIRQRLYWTAYLSGDSRLAWIKRTGFGESKWMANASSERRQQECGCTLGNEKENGREGWNSCEQDINNFSSSHGAVSSLPSDFTANLCKGFWDNSSWILCADGRFRRIPSQEMATKSVFQRMADGFPQGLDLCGSDRAFPIGKTIPHMTALLRGYGNAIIPPLAAVFVRSVLEEIRES